jgi:hypothetical protein
MFGACPTGRGWSSAPPFVHLHFSSFSCVGDSTFFAVFAVPGTPSRPFQSTILFRMTPSPSFLAATFFLRGRKSRPTNNGECSPSSSNPGRGRIFCKGAWVQFLNAVIGGRFSPSTCVFWSGRSLLKG